MPHACKHTSAYVSIRQQILTQLEQSCCRTLVLPLYGSSGGGGVFPAFSAYTSEAQHVRDLVANGNVLVLVGGTMVPERPRR